MADSVAIDMSSLLRPGVFVLSNHGRVSYVGKAKVLLVALAHHALRNRDASIPSWFPIKAIPFDHIEVIPCDTTKAHAYAAALIEFHNPVHNRPPRQPHTSVSPFPTTHNPQPIRRTL